MKKVTAFILTIGLTLAVFFVSINIGGLKTTVTQLINGLFFEYDDTVAIIIELRFPRIIVAVLGGALMAVSGVLMQSVMKNPLADPGIIGVTSGASVMAVLVTMFIPALGAFTPIFSFLGGMLSFAVVYILAWNGGISPIRLLLVGIAVDAVCSGITSALSSATGGSYTGATSIINANISLKTWDDVKVLAIYMAVAAVLCIVIANKSNLLALSDQTLHGIGINASAVRIIVSAVSVLMASIFTAVIGSVSFLGLIVPHIARLVVGNDNRVLIPYSACLGSLVFLVADTFGRVIAYPYEISSSIIMSVIGGPIFIILLKRSRNIYG